MAVTALNAIKAAQNIVNQSKPTDEKTGQKPVGLPTARTRTALEMLTRHTATTFAEQRLDIKALTNDLFAWSGKPRATKMVMRKIQQMLADEINYQKNVELIGYAVAASRMLEADRLVRLLDAKADGVYLPTWYTLQFAQKIEKVFGRYAPERQERLLISLWELAHKDRWWQVHTPAEEVDRNIPVDADVQEATLEKFEKANPNYSAKFAYQLNSIGPNEKIVAKLKDYRNDMARGRDVYPDIAVISSKLTWLPFAIRPESPVVSMLSTLMELAEAIDYTFPKQPNTFADVFPALQLYAGKMFPYHSSVLAVDGQKFAGGKGRAELIRTSGALHENKEYMGNCTDTYETRLLAGTTFLLRVHYEDEIYNAAITANNVGEAWRQGEINSRFNRGNVPQIVQAFITDVVSKLPRARISEEKSLIDEQNDKVKKATGRRKIRVVGG